MDKNVLALALASVVQSMLDSRKDDIAEAPETYGFDPKTTPTSTGVKTVATKCVVQDLIDHPEDAAGWVIDEYNELMTQAKAPNGWTSIDTSVE